MCEIIIFVIGGGLADGFHNRYFEFQHFERKFEDCISKSAVRTKFQQHSQRGMFIIADIRTIMDRTYDRTQQLRTEKTESKKEIHEKLNFTKQQMELLTREMKDKISQMVEDVKQKASHFMGTYVTGFC
jgi:mitofusin